MATGKQETTVKIKADVSGFNDEIRKANSAMSGLRSELKLNAAQMKAAGQSVEALEKAQSLLEQQSVVLAQKVGALDSALSAARDAFGEDSEEARKYERQLNAAKTAQENLRAQIAKASEEVERHKAAQEGAQSAYGRLSSEIAQQRAKVAQLQREYANAAIEFGENSSQATALKSDLSRLGAELRQSEQRMEQAESAARELAGGLDKAERSARECGSSMGDIAAGNVIADVAQNAAGALLGLSEATDENRANMNRLETAYESSGRSIEEATEVYQGFLGICGDSDQAAEAALDMRNLADAGADVDEWYRIAAGASASFGDALPIENLIESANETVRTGAVTGGLADALNWTSEKADALNAALGDVMPGAMAAFNDALAQGMSSEDAMNAALAECSDEQERQTFLTEALKAQYGALGDEFNETNADLAASRIAQDNLLQAQSKLADAIAPLQTALTNLAADGVDFLAEHLNIIIPIVGAAAGAFVAFKASMAISAAMQAFPTLLTGIKTAMMGLSWPILAVVAAIAAMVGAFVYGYNNCEPFRAAIDQLVGVFRDTFGPILEQVGGFISQGINDAFTFMGEVITTYVIPLLEQFGVFLTETVAPVLQQFGQWFTDNIIPALQNLWQWIQENIIPMLQEFGVFLQEQVFPVLSEFWGWFQEHIIPILQDLWAFIQEKVLPVLSDLGGFILENVVPALQNMWQWFCDNILPILQDVWSFIENNILPIFEALGNFIFDTVIPALESLWGWFSDNILPVLEDVFGMVDKVMGKIGEFADFIGSIHWSLPELKLPHIKYDVISVPVLGSIPNPATLRVEWYAQGGVLMRPTVFGANGGSLMAGGEAGPEAVAPIDVLQGYVADAVARAEGGGAAMICAAIDKLADRVTVLEVNGREFARATAGDYDRVGGFRQGFAGRGLAL